MLVFQMVAGQKLNKGVGRGLRRMQAAVRRRLIQEVKETQNWMS